MTLSEIFDSIFDPCIFFLECTSINEVSENSSHIKLGKFVVYRIYVDRKHAVFVRDDTQDFATAVIHAPERTKSNYNKTTDTINTVTHN